MNRKRTKIVATLSDKKCDPEFIKELYEAGMDFFRITGDPEKISSGKELFVSLKTFTSDVPPGSIIMIDDGDIELKALKKEGDSLKCKALNDGIIGSRKSVNVPGVKIQLPSLTDKERTFIKMAAGNDVDFIAPSF